MNWALEIDLGTKKSAKVLGAVEAFMTVYGSTSSQPSRLFQLQDFCQLAAFEEVF